MTKSDLPAPLVHRDIDGLEMGVLPDGTAYLSARALARLCGVSHVALIQWKYDINAVSGRDAKVREALRRRGYHEAELFTEVLVRGAPTRAYPSVVCTAVLEYYAREAKNEQAIEAMCRLIDGGLRTLIYQSLDLDEDAVSGDPFLDFQQRLLDNPAPPGYFNVIAEMARLVLVAARNGLQSNWSTVPDISAGKAWGRYWEANGLAEQYGERTKYPHHYPSHYPQSESNPQAANAYPLEALGAFQIWLQTTYTTTHFPKYLMEKARKGAIGREEATALIALIQRELAIPERT